MLESALATRFEPGSNRRDQAIGANWSFVLPSLEPERLLCLGAPSGQSLTALADRAHSIVVWCPHRQHRRRLAALVETAGWSHVTVEARIPEPLPRPGDGFDLVCLSADMARSLPGGDDQLLLVPKLLRPDSQVYVELAGRRGRRLGRILLAELARHGYTDGRRLWLAPRRGEVRAAVPAASPEIRRYLVGRGLHRPESSSGPLDRAVRALGGRRAGHHPTHRAGVLVGTGSHAGPRDVPRFVANLAGEAGLDLSGYRWGLSVRGRYRSRKAVYLLFAEGSLSPDYVVKMTRDPRLNHRLENEHRALTQLERAGIGAAGTYPHVRFSGSHGGLAVLGQEALEGVGFEQASTASDRCPHGRAAAGWLIDLARATRRQAPATEVANALGQLLEHYDRFYAPGPSERSFLEDQVAALATSTVPSVFQHGDPGTWNLLVTPSGGVAFLDWEAAEPHGMPLWDLFHFFRSYGVLASRRAGVRDQLESSVRQFLSDTPVSRLLSESVDVYAGRIEMSRDLAGPLFVTGWMHRALKEANRLNPDHLPGGNYVRLLRRTITEWQNPVLRRLLASRG
jgi:hypothetical protein